jgi:hypothetical protein
MLTIFATPKPFDGHIGIIQRNAIASWVRLHPDCEVILFGEEPGAAEVAKELGVRHEPGVRHTEFGSKRLDYIFARAHEIARHDLLCYVNCDIILPQSLYEATARVAAWSPEFLMIGRRWDTRLAHRLDFEAGNWETLLRDLALHTGTQQLHYAVDYFVFSRGLYDNVPPFAVGRVYWDHWLVWRARSMKVPVVDASADVLAIHQDHDYAYHADGLRGVKTDSESRRNRALAGGQLHLYTIDHATHQLVDRRIEDKPGRWHVPASFFVRTYSSQLWYWILKASCRVRHARGLHRETLAQVQQRVRSIIGG